MVDFNPPSAVSDEKKVKMFKEMIEKAKKKDREAFEANLMKSRRMFLGLPKATEEIEK